MNDKQIELMKTLEKSNKKTQFNFIDVFRRLYNEMCSPCRKSLYIKVMRKKKEGKIISYEGIVNTLCSSCLDNAIEKTKKAGGLL